MRIAYIIEESYCLTPFNGIRVQADTWASELERQGHTVARVSPWEQYDWASFDVIHLFGPLALIHNLTSELHPVCDRIALSPIIDTVRSVRRYGLASRLGMPQLFLTSRNFDMRRSRPYVSKWFARSEFEKSYITGSYGVAESDVEIIPLSFRTLPAETYPAKEPFCLHVSKLTDSRKNVMRLIQAAIKYRFQLTLAGNISCQEEFAPMKSLIDDHDNITYLGRVSDDELRDLYSRAKVFALPSVNEGVGMVALEAAALGCDIVITDIGGPKEYYGDRAFKVNPYDTDAIGKAIMEALAATDKQPALMEFVKSSYNLETCVGRLAQCYEQMCSK